MELDRARGIAEDARAEHRVPDEAKVGAVTKWYIEVAEAASTEAGPVRDVLAWLVRFRFRSSWVELAVSDDDGEIVRTKWSR